MKEPQAATSGSHWQVEWLYDCGKVTSASIARVVSGNTSSCGRCGVMPAEYWAGMKFGSLRMKEPREMFRGTRQRVEWLCDCGLISHASVLNVTSGQSTSCGRCHVLSLQTITGCVGNSGSISRAFENEVRSATRELQRESSEVLRDTRESGILARVDGFGPSN
jgi:ribosomal protein S27AE